MRKLAESIGSAPPDPVVSQAATSPVPSPVMGNKPAPGQTGPRGLAPRTTYSRVNTGTPAPSMALSGLKGGAARGAEFLPAKTAEVQTMEMSQRPNLQDMMKAAMAGTANRVDINYEAARQLASRRGESHEKVASAPYQPDHYSSEHIEKMASALDYIASEIKVADDGNVQQPGQGPGSLDVLEATSSEGNIDAGEFGRALSQFQPKQDPPTQREEVQIGNAGTGMDTNDDTMHPEQPTKPIVNQNASITPSNPLSTPTTQTKESSAAQLIPLAALAGMGVWGHQEGKQQREEGEAKPEWGVGKTLGSVLVQPYGAYQLGRSIGWNKGTPPPAEAQAAVQQVEQEKSALAARNFGRMQKAAGVGSVLESLGKKTVGVLGRTGGAEAAMNPRTAKAIGAGVIGTGTLGLGGAALALRKKKEEGKTVTAALIRKLAEDALSPANIEAGRQDMPDYSASGEGMPAQPSDVRSQARSMLGSNEAAINYTKGQAKADPISDVNQVLVQSAMTRQNDPVLHKVLDNTGAAGVKISSVNETVKVAAARALLSNLLSKAAAETEQKNDGKKKEKGSMMGGAPASPSSASGFNASSLS